MIESFKDGVTEAIFFGKAPKGFPSDLVSRAANKLKLIDDARMLDALRYPQGNHLEALKGDREGQYSIRINVRLRVCFEWRNGGAWNVEIVDYH